MKRFGLLALGLPLVAGALFWGPQRGEAYIEAAHSFGAVVTQSSNVFLMRVEMVDREKKVIVFRKVQDIKGKHGTDVIKHNLNQPGLRPNEWKIPLDWAEPGKMAVMFHNGGLSETCIGNWWYQSSNGGDWWNHVHGEPFLLRTYAGSPEKLAGVVAAVQEGREVIVPCMMDTPDKEELHNRRGKMQRMRVNIKLQDYNAKRDFVGWGGEDFRRIVGMPGFSHISSLGRVDPEAQGVAIVDLDGDGKQDVCLVGGSRVSLLQNNGEALSELAVPGIFGARASVWADYNGDGKADLLLATPSGLRLFTNTGAALRDDSHLLPDEALCDVSAAAWLDYDGDGRPDILFATPYQGLRLYHNTVKQQVAAAPEVKFGTWYFLGPIDNTGDRAFQESHAAEERIDLNAEYTGKGGRKIRWQEGKFPDAAINNLNIFNDNSWSSVCLYREIEATGDIDVPVSLGSDDTLVVFLNGEKIVADNSHRAAAPDQNQAVLKLRRGKNQLLMKVGNGDGDWSFYFAAGKAQPAQARGKAFTDVSAAVGLGPKGIAADLKGDSLSVCDVNGDGRPDFLYGAGTGVLVLSARDDKGQPTFVEARASGISYNPGRVGPVFGDFDGDGHPDLFVPQKGACKLFRNDGKGNFTDVSAKAGALGDTECWATSAAWGDFDNDGQLDLMVGCLRGPNRFFRNKGDGTFEDASEAVGLTQRVFNTQALALVDLNNDGFLDLVLNNEGQDSVVLLGNNAQAGKRTPLSLTVEGHGVVGSRVEVADKAGKTVAAQQISGGDGRGQPATLARFALEPGSYRVQVRLTSGQVLGRDLTLGSDRQRERIAQAAEKK